MELKCHHEYDVMSHFPLLSASEDLKKWSGFISTTQGKTFLFSVAVPQFPSTTDIQLIKEELDGSVIQYWSSLIEQVSRAECATFLEYLKLLEAQMLQGNNVTRSRNADIDISDLYSSVIEEIEAIGVKNVVSLSPDFKEITIKQMDKSGRDHQLKLIIPEGYPQSAPIVKSEIPLPSDSIAWPARIKEINQMFKSYLEKCCLFWDDMEELDNRVRVLDPMPPNKGHFHRKILLEDNVIIHLVFNALTPRALPQISFTGPEKYLDAYNAAIDNECNAWDDDLKVLQNLKSILECEFVMRENENGETLDDQVPCPVCYVYSFEEEIPDITCNCGAAFHRQCIHDLFVSDAPKSALKRFVECPICQMEIRIPAGLTTAQGW